MKKIYVYFLDTMADWELGYVTAELNSGRFFKKDAQQVSLKTVSYSKEPIHTMGGLTIKEDWAFRRFLLRGKRKIHVELILLAFAFDIRKLHARIHSNRTGSQLFEAKIA